MSIKDNILKTDKGLGDTIERITKATGIKKVVDTLSEVTGKDCNCGKRKEKLNKFILNAQRYSDYPVDQS